jgi:hypothetical protein
MKNFALGRLPAGHMNKTEAAYAAELEMLRRCGAVQWYLFEGIKLRLADNTFYSPDFVVMSGGGFIECHEVKGFWTDDARVKIKVAASSFPFKFIAIKKTKQGWEEEAF